MHEIPLPDGEAALGHGSRIASREDHFGTWRSDREQLMLVVGDHATCRSVPDAPEVHLPPNDGRPRCNPQHPNTIDPLRSRPGSSILELDRNDHGPGVR